MRTGKEASGIWHTQGYGYSYNLLPEKLPAFNPPAYFDVRSRFATGTRIIVEGRMEHADLMFLWLLQREIPIVNAPAMQFHRFCSHSLAISAFRVR